MKGNSIYMHPKCENSALNDAPLVPFPISVYLSCFYFYNDYTSSRIIGVCNILAYVSAICLFLLDLCPATTLIAILISAPEAMSIARAFNPSLVSLQLLGGRPKKGRSQEERPYRLEGLVKRILAHSPCVVLAVFVDNVLRVVVAAGTAAAAAAEGDGSGYWHNCFAGAVVMLFSPSLVLRCLPLVPFVYMFFVQKPCPAPPFRTSSSATSKTPSSAQRTMTVASNRVVVTGGGIGGLILGSCLQQIGLPFEVSAVAATAAPRGCS